MLQLKFWVKYLAILTSLITMSCTHSQKNMPEKPTLLTGQAVPFLPQPEWLALNVDPKVTEDLRQQLERLGLNLSHRSEAHLTVVTPPEFKTLSSHLKMDDLNWIATEQDIQKIKWTPLCLGRGTVTGTDMQTFFIVTSAPGLLKMRSEIQKLYVKKGGSKKAFLPAAYEPHITVGFTHRDLHAQDGVKKDRSSCWMQFH